MDGGGTTMEFWDTPYPLDTRGLAACGFEAELRHSPGVAVLLPLKSLYSPGRVILRPEA